MLRTLKCPYCGQLNEVVDQHINHAICITCKREFSSPQSTDFEVAPETEEKGKIDVSKWLVKVGGAKEQKQYVEESFWKKMKKVAAKIPFAKEAVAMYYCATDANTPSRAKLIAFGALAYLILPFDLIPDFILALGYTDDAAAFWFAYKSISIHITDEHRQRAEEWLKK